MQRLIFLDIDGVLNNTEDDNISLENYYGHYSKVLVERLNQITDKTDAKIVLSSTWRLGRTLEVIQDMLKSMGIKAECIGATVDLRHEHSYRGNEILKWIKDHKELVGDYHKFKSYVILDDDSDMLYWQRYNFVQTHGLVGLTDKHVERSIKILENPPEYINTQEEYVMEYTL